MKKLSRALIGLLFLISLAGCSNKNLVTRIPVTISNSINEILWEMEWGVIYSKDDNVLIGIEIVSNEDYGSEMETQTLRKFLNDKGQDCFIVESYESGVNEESSYIGFDINTFEVQVDEYLISGTLEYRDYYFEGEEEDVDGRHMDREIKQVNESIKKRSLLIGYDNQKNPTMIVGKSEQENYVEIQYKEIADKYPEWTIEEKELVSQLAQEAFVEFFYLHEHFCYGIF